MAEIRFNNTGFIICLLNPKTKEKVYFFCEEMEWKYAYARALEMMEKPFYRQFGLLSITRTIKYENL